MKPRKNAQAPQGKFDLVEATMTVKTAGKGETLTGNLSQVQKVGRNTGWAKKGDANVPRYGQRRSAMLADLGQQHPLAQSLVGRHSGVVDENTDKRGLSCAEGHALMSTHQELTRLGKVEAAANLDAFKHSLIKEVEMPTFSANTKKATKNRRLAAYESNVQKRELQLNELAKTMTGMASWDEYAQHEASHLAWNDIQHHGQLSNIHHHQTSDINPGKAMDACEQCRADIVSKMRNK